MKRLVYTLALILATTLFSTAQERKRTLPSPEARAERVSAQLKEKLALTEEQHAKVKQLEKERVAKMDAWRKKDMEARKVEMNERRAYMKEHQSKMDNILTAEQKEKAELMRKEMGDKVRDKMKDRHKRQPENRKRPEKKG